MMKKRGILTLLVMGVFLLSTVSIANAATLESPTAVVSPGSIAQNAATKSVEQVSPAQAQNELRQRAETANAAVPAEYVMLFKCSKKMIPTGTTDILGALEDCKEADGYSIKSEPGEMGYIFKNVMPGTTPLRICTWDNLGITRTSADYLLPARRAPFDECQPNKDIIDRCWEYQLSPTAEVIDSKWRIWNIEYEGKFTDPVNKPDVGHIVTGDTNENQGIIDAEGNPCQKTPGCKDFDGKLVYKEYEPDSNCADQKIVGHIYKAALVNQEYKAALVNQDPSFAVDSLIYTCWKGAKPDWRTIGTWESCPHTFGGRKPLGFVMKSLPSAGAEGCDVATCVDNAYKSKKALTIDWDSRTPVAELITSDQIKGRIEQAEAKIQDVLCRNKCYRDQLGKDFVSANCKKLSANYQPAAQAEQPAAQAEQPAAQAEQPAAEPAPKACSDLGGQIIGGNEIRLAAAKKECSDNGCTYAEVSRKSVSRMGITITYITYECKPKTGTLPTLTFKKMLGGFNWIDKITGRIVSAFQ